jgi:hypothetical protein
MSVELEIRDGNPWWLSPDIWTVPGDDPEGPAGTPTVGVPAYLWANVRNGGTTDVGNATVRFYWANPNAGFDRNSANLIGSAFVSLNAGQAQDVLCLTPWIPAFVNGGHECVLAEAFHTSDPLTTGINFEVTTDRHVAQRNLNVVMASMRRFALNFEVHNRARKPADFRIDVAHGELHELKALMPRYGHAFENLKPGKVSSWHLSDQPAACDRVADKARTDYASALRLEGHQRRGLSLAGEIDGGAALLHIRQFYGKQLVGGLSVLIIDR